jgi:hypothetical protein
MARQKIRLVGVYRSESEARAAAEAACRSGADPADVRVGDPLDRVVSLEGEMREEMDHTIAGPGNVGPFTPEVQRGMSIGVFVGALVGLVLALPLAAIPFGDVAVWLRVLLVAVVGVVVGGTVGWVLGGGFGAKRGEEPLAAERGVTLSTTATERLQDVLAQTHPIRLDLVTEHGEPVRAVTTEPGEPIARTIGRNAASEERKS